MLMIKMINRIMTGSQSDGIYQELRCDSRAFGFNYVFRVLVVAPNNEKLTISAKTNSATIDGNLHGGSL